MDNKHEDLSKYRDEAVDMTPDDDVIIMDDEDEGDFSTPPEDLKKEKEYTGKGVVITKEEFQKANKDKMKEGIPVGPMAQKEKQEDVHKYMAEQNDEISKQERIALRNYMKDKKRGFDVNVIIDKTNLGQIEFTEEEKAKLEKAKRIKLVAVEEEGFKSIKIKKNYDPNKAHKISKKIFDRSLSPFIAIASGYTGKMGNVSCSEALKLIDVSDQPTANSLTEKWSVLFDKLRYCSIGKFDDFDSFLKNTAYYDYDAMVYAILCASYPDDDKITLQCTNEKCGKSFEINYSNSSLLDKDSFTDKMKERIMEIVDNEIYEDKAKEVHENSLIKQVKRVAVTDDDSILLDLYIPTAYDVIEHLYRGIEDTYKNDPKYNREFLLLHFIKAAYIFDDSDGDEGYIELDDPNEILENILLALTETQIRKLWAIINDYSSDLTYSFSIKNVVCPFCRTKIENQPIKPEILLFLKVRRLLSTDFA